MKFYIGTNTPAPLLPKALANNQLKFFELHSLLETPLVGDTVMNGEDAYKVIERVFRSLEFSLIVK